MFRLKQKHTYLSNQLKYIDQLKGELSTFGHEMPNVTNNRHEKWHSPLSLFYIDIKQMYNNKDTFQIIKFMNCTV